MADNIILNNVLMTQSTGQKSNMPTVAPDGKLLVVRDTGKPTELWCGTGIGVEPISSGGNGNGFSLFDIVMKDHVLSYEETLGFAPLGTYVYKEAVPGTRYGYPDFYQKCLDEYNGSTSQSEYVSSNYAQMFGTITDNEGVLSGFSNGNYILGGYISIPAGATWEYVTKLNSSDHSTTNVIGGFGNQQLKSLSTDINTDGTLSVFITSNGSNWDIANGARSSLTLNDNTDYYMKRYFTGTEYKVDISTTGAFSGEETNYITVNSTTSIFSTNCPVDIAGWMNNGTFTGFRGTIDLNGCYININGERWWTGTNRLNYEQSTNKHRFYDIADKATFDNMYAITGEAWYYGIDTTNERIFTPRSTRFRNGTTSDVGGYQAAGLPNITGDFAVQNAAAYSSGAFVDEGLITLAGPSGSDQIARRISFNASRSSSLYGSSNTVEYSSTKLIPYMVVGNVANESSAIDIVDITTTENDTLPLLHHIAADEALNHPSWVRSSGQWNDGNVYTTVYEYLVNEYQYGTSHTDTFTSPNGTTYTVDYKTINGKKVVDYTNALQVDELYSACGSAWYYVINQNDMTFRLPMSHNYECYTSDSTRVGLDVFAGLPNITGNTAYFRTHTPTASSQATGAFSSNATKNNNLSADTGSVDDSQSLRFRASNSNPIYGNSTTVTPAHTEFYLYFKVANAVQNLELLDAGKVLEAVNTVIPDNSSLIAGYAMPSDTYEDLVLGASGSTYTAPANGYFVVDKVAGSTGKYLDMYRISPDNTMGVNNVAGGSGQYRLFLPVLKGDKVRISYTFSGATNFFRFIYAEGSKGEA